jgi:hypothetical protein
MGQFIHTKNFGSIELEHGGWQNGSFHIARCTNGAYVHITGLPVKAKKEFVQAGMEGADLEAAKHWFDHRGETAENPSLRVMVEPDGSCIFEDGSPITSISQLTQALKPGPMLDAALLWFTKRHMADEGKAKGKGIMEGAKKTAKATKTKAPPVRGKAAPPAAAQITA